MTDGELVRRALQADVAAYDQLARRWAARVLAVCHARIARRDVAEDLAQEALLRGLEGLATLKSPERFGPWLRGIAVHVCQDWGRASAARDAAFATDGSNGNPYAIASSQPPIGFDIESREESGRLLDQVHSLPGELREVVLLYYYDDMTYDELANVLGVSKATVNVRLAKARDALRRQLSPASR